MNAISVLIIGASATGAFGKAYYVDCLSGDELKSGLSQSEAWKSMEKANTAALAPGDSLRLKRGCIWTGPLKVDRSGTEAQKVFIGAYGIGATPIIRNGISQNIAITASHVVVESLAVDFTSSAPTDPGCQDQPVGWRVGIDLRPGSAHNLIRYVEVTGSTEGIHIAKGSHHNRIFNSMFRKNTVLSVNDKANPDNDAGASGILVNGDDNEIAYNRFEGNVAWCSYDYGVDGSAIEIYEAKRNSIHHNRSEGDLTFTELGGSGTDSTLFAYNLVSSKLSGGSFAILRGALSNFGPNRHTRIYNNTAYLTGNQSQGVVCHGGCTAEIMDLKNNIVWAESKAIYVDSQPLEDHNLYWAASGKPYLQDLVKSATSKVADPLFVDPMAGDFRLRAESPARDAGGALSGAGLETDLSGHSTPRGLARDMGALEFIPSTGLSFPSSNLPPDRSQGYPPTSNRRLYRGKTIDAWHDVSGKSWEIISGEFIDPD